jgi:poly(hydroxyalkanoate) granule-associated protein
MKTNKLSEQVLNSANKIWLAGLGAYHRAEDSAREQGEESFEWLVEEGRRFQQRMKEELRGKGSKTSQALEGLINQSESQLDIIRHHAHSHLKRRLERIESRLQMHTKGDNVDNDKPDD